MFRPVSSTILCFVLLTSLTLFVPASAGAQAEYTITTMDSIDTPTRTVSVGGQSYTVSALGSADAGSTITYQISGGDPDRYYVTLYNSENMIEQSWEHTDAGSYSFDTAGLSPGTYVLTLTVDGVTYDLFPVVVSGYEFQVDAPAQKSASESVSIDVTLTSASGTPSRVEIAVMNEDTQENYVMTKVGDQSYNVLISDLAPDEYRIFAGTRGTQEINGEDELTGISSVQSLSITASQTTTTTTTTSPTGSTTTTSSTNGGVATSTSPTTTTPPTTTVPNGTTTTVTSSTTSTIGGTSQAGPSTTTATSTTTAIQPASSTTSSTGVDTPGFTTVLTTVALLGALAFGTRRRN